MGFNLDNYTPVNERLAKFYEDHPTGKMLTVITEHDRESGFVIMRAEAYRGADDQFPASSGHAFELRGQGHVNATSYIENCETSAVGRALANLGYEIKKSIASREEMQKVQRMTSQLDRSALTAEIISLMQSGGRTDDEIATARAWLAKANDQKFSEKLAEVRAKYGTQAADAAA